MHPQEGYSNFHEINLLYMKIVYRMHHFNNHSFSFIYMNNLQLFPKLTFFFVLQTLRGTFYRHS